MAIKSVTPARGVTWRGGLIALLVYVAGSAMGTAHAGSSAIVVDDTDGQVITAVNPDEAAHPASLTKMMTLYLTFQALRSGTLQVDQELPVSSWAASKAPTKLDLRSGQTITVEDCVLGMITKSANDAATVVAEGLGGTESHFVDMMNAQAQLLGMSNTRFANASGLPDPDDTTSARDMAKLAMALYHEFPQYSHYFATKEFMFRGRLVRGHNNLMDKYPGMDGLKTGYTNAAGFNLASTATKDGRRLFSVVLGGRSAATRDRLMARLLDDGFDDHETPAELVAQVGMVPAAAKGSRSKSSAKATALADATPSSRRHHRRGKADAVAARGSASCSKKKAVTCPAPKAATAQKVASVGSSPDK
ncbi:MAG TPA: D-alanyl-D-alanine carboxypeptidase family protein [Dyella sp.]|uniref:D-alanyl-D-alanine carboxypeptidase family protein n=1 Tax=Dyella sp. TaxID=1869338 RepID=UPI002D78448D|nr:D-alanyl-D-alanine carboxypeptidase family protein [Dyella sp.]HET6553913.1 D-alanyl-D-alanine carboxypeptidase family protein [Dyella sp.]